MEDCEVRLRVPERYQDWHAFWPPKSLALEDLSLIQSIGKIKIRFQKAECLGRGFGVRNSVVTFPRVDRILSQRVIGARKGASRD